MANNDGLNSTWDFENTHVDANLNPSKDLISAARCIIYAKPSSFGSSDSNSSVQYYRCGLVQGYGFSEGRDVSRIFELGSEVPYLIPGRTAGELSLSRIMLFGADLVNILYYSAQNGGVSNSDLYSNNITRVNDEDSSDKIIRSISQITTPVDLLFTYYKNTGETGDKAKTSARYSRVFKECMITSRSEQVDAGQIIVGEQVRILYSKMGPVKIN